MEEERAAYLSLLGDDGDEIEGLEPRDVEEVILWLKARLLAAVRGLVDVPDPCITDDRDVNLVQETSWADLEAEIRQLHRNVG
jgi:hypothetical protein